MPLHHNELSHPQAIDVHITDMLMIEPRELNVIGGPTREFST